MTVMPNSGLPARTLISQYANSPTLVQLINNMDDYINPATDFDAFYGFIWNVETAQGFGLDIWGRIVGVDSRELTIPSDDPYLGFDEAYLPTTQLSGPQPFNQAPFWTGGQSTQTYTLTDAAYRKLILVKALANISDSSARSLNQLLTNLFRDRGRCYVLDLGDMQIRFVFEFVLEPYEYAILTQSNAVPRPAAVGYSISQFPSADLLGFVEAGDGVAPLGQGTLFPGVLNAN